MVLIVRLNAGLDAAQMEKVGRSKMVNSLKTLKELYIDFLGITREYDIFLLINSDYCFVNDLCLTISPCHSITDGDIAFCVFNV